LIIGAGAGSAYTEPAPVILSIPCTTYVVGFAAAAVACFSALSRVRKVTHDGTDGGARSEVRTG